MIRFLAGHGLFIIIIAAVVAMRTAGQSYAADLGHHASTAPSCDEAVVSC